MNEMSDFDLEEVIVGSLLLEGETLDDERLINIEPEMHQETHQNEPPVAIESKNHQISIENHQIRKEDLPCNANLTIQEGGRGKCIWKETKYVRMLKEGSGVTGMRGGVLPKGMQHGTTVVDDDERVGDNREQDVEQAMATVIERTQGLELSYAEAKRRLDWPKWEDAIQKELNGLENSGTYCLVKQPPDTNIVDSKWVFRIKLNAAGEVDKYKARLVARGFTQIYGIDYYETCSPVARLASFCLLMAIAACNSWALDNFNFDQAFLNSKLGDDEVIYMEHPPGYETKDRKEWVWRWLKSLYGLRQGLKNWYDALHQAMVKLGITRFEVDHRIFFRRVGKDIVILAIHVNDGMITGNNVALIKEFKEDMNKKYKLTDLGPVFSLLGIKVTQDLVEKTISLSQQAYIKAIITKFNFDDLKTCSTPMDPSALLSKSQSPTKLEDIARMRKIPYREAVGSLMYTAMGTRPDIAFAMSTVAQYSKNLGWQHWEAVKQIFRHLLGTKKMELTYGGEERGLVGYVDADGALQDHRRAISGYVFMVDRGAVSWSSKKQELVTLSTTEAEYVAATHTAKEAIWLCRLLTELFDSIDSSTTSFSDSKSAIALAHDGHYHARTKHIDIHYHFILYIIEAGTIKLVYCPTDDMTADTLTKVLPSVKAKHFASALGLCMV